MNFELSGTIIDKFETIRVSDTFQKREFVVETLETNGGREIRNQVKFQLTQDRCALVDDLSNGDQVKVSFNIRGRRWEKDGRVNYFTNLEAWRIERSAVSENSDAPPPPSVDDLPSDNENDDLPF